MLSGEKILITGPAGQIAFPLASYLAEQNDVWGIARFTDPASRERVEAAGIRAVRGDVADGVPADLPDDFTYVLHLAAFMGAGVDYDHAIRTNAEGTGLLLQHCRKAKAALVMSTHAVYKPHPDPYFDYPESYPLGDANAPYCPTYSVSKTAQEAVARFCARAFDLPVVIARMNASYGPNGGLPLRHLERALAGQDVVVKADPLTYSPIHQDDINAQTEALLDAATTDGLIVNWAGDEVVSAQEWCAEIAELVNHPVNVRLEPVPGSQIGLVADVTRRAAITGPCRVRWHDGIRRSIAQRHPELVSRSA